MASLPITPFLALLALAALPSPGPRAGARGAAPSLAEPVQTELPATRADRLAAALLEAGPAERDARLEELFAAAGRERVGEVLTARAQRAARIAQRGGTLAQLERLARDRSELDRARAAALDLIEDEKQYFYPYSVPAVEPRVAARYPAVQREVAELVDSVRKAWGGRRKVKLPSDFRAAAEELAWDTGQATRLRLHLDLLADLPDWVTALPADSRVELATFAWTPAERAALDRDRSVRQHNEAVWKAARKGHDLPEPARPGKAETDQVRITNDYRVMMGRRALVWNATLMQAAQGHSDWMSRWGVLSHYEEGSDETYDATARAERLGYTWVSGENCSMGRSDPQSAFEGWFGSSGHHRNMLAEHHREMAAAEAGGYWTQDYGTREPSEEELESWRD